MYFIFATAGRVKNVIKNVRTLLISDMQKISALLLVR